MMLGTTLYEIVHIRTDWVLKQGVSEYQTGQYGKCLDRLTRLGDSLHGFFSNDFDLAESRYFSGLSLQKMEKPAETLAPLEQAAALFTKIEHAKGSADAYFEFGLVQSKLNSRAKKA